jgi:hypothetical protein
VRHFGQTSSDINPARYGTLGNGERLAPDVLEHLRAEADEVLLPFTAPDACLVVPSPRR